MVPFYFGQSGRRLFGVYEPAATVRLRRGVVLCYPIGREYYMAHRAFRFLARELSRAGMDVLRFDLSGTGDSEGEVTDFLVTDWVADVGRAVDELKDMTGLAKVGLVGLRFGAALAARSAENRDDIECVVLWDLTLDPDECIGGPGRDLHSPELLRGLRSLGAQMGGTHDRTLVVMREGGRFPPDGLGDKITADSDFRRYEGPRAWQEEENFGSAGLPTLAIRTIAEWIAEPK